MTNIEKNITKQRYNKQKKSPKHSTLKYFQKGNLFKPNAILTQLKNFSGCSSDSAKLTFHTISFYKLLCEFSQNKYYWYYYSQQCKRIFLVEFRWESTKKDVKIDPFALAFGPVHRSDINLFKAESALISNISPLYVKWDMNYLPVFQISA